MTMVVRIAKIDFVDLLRLENKVSSGICTGTHGLEAYLTGPMPF